MGKNLLQIRSAMKIFKTYDGLMEFVSNHENIETLESGEVMIKDWNDDAKALEKFKRDHGLATTDRKALRGKNEELTKRNAELSERLDSVNNELTSLKEVHSSGDKDVVQKMIKEKSDLQTKYNAIEAEYKDMKIRIPELETQVESYKTAHNRSRILDAVKKAAAIRKIPQTIIDDPIFFDKVVVDEFAIDDVGNIFTKGDVPQTVDNFIVAMQKDRPHWMPVSQGDSGDNGKVSDEQAAIAGLFAQSGSSAKYTQPINGDACMTDEQAAIAALFG